jgi:hypothetical protein
MKRLSVKQCDALDDAHFAHRKIFYAVVDKNYHWRTNEKHGEKYIQWTKTPSCSASLRQEKLQQQHVSVLQTASHVYVVLQLPDAKPGFVQSPKLRYGFERRLSRKLLLLKAAGAVVLGATLLMAGRALYKDVATGKLHSAQEEQEKIAGLQLKIRETDARITEFASEKASIEAQLRAKDFELSHTKDEKLKSLLEAETRRLELQEEKEALQEKIRTKEQERDALCAEMQARASQAKKELEEKLATVQEERKEQLDLAEKAKEAVDGINAKLDAANAEIQRISDEKAAAESQKTALEEKQRDATEQIKQLETQAAVKRNKHKERVKELTDKLKERPEITQDRLQSLLETEQEKTDLEDKIRTNELSIRELENSSRQEKEAINAQLTDKTTQLDALREQMSEALATRQKLEDDKVALEQKLTEKQAVLDTSTEKVKNLETEATNLADRINRYKESASMVEVLSAEIETLVAKTAELEEKQKTSIKTIKDESREKEAQFAEAMRSLDAKLLNEQTKYETLVSEYAVKKQQAEDTIRALDEQSTTKTQADLTLLLQVQVEKTDLEERMRTSIKTLNDASREKEAQFAAATQSLEAQLHEEQRKLELLGRDYAAKTQEAKDLEQKSTTTQAELTRLLEVEVKKIELEEKVGKMKTKIQELKNAKKDLTMMNVAISRRNEVELNQRIIQRQNVDDRPARQKKCMEDLAKFRDNYKEFEKAYNKAPSTLYRNLYATTTKLFTDAASCKQKWVAACVNKGFCELSKTLEADLVNARSDLLNAVQIFVRINPKEEEGEKCITNADSAFNDEVLKLNNLKLDPPKSTTYKNMKFYDTSYGTNEAFFKGQDDIGTLKESVEKVARGYSQVILGFGASGAGKTYTIFGDDESLGIYQLARTCLEELGCALKMAVFEEYVDKFNIVGTIVTGKLIFLLDGIGIQKKLKEITTEDEKDEFKKEVGEDILKRITQHRLKKNRIKATFNNFESSRSHLYIVLEATKTPDIKGYLTFVDMAGFEQPYDIYSKLIKFKDPQYNTAKICLNGTISNRWGGAKEFPEENVTETMANILNKKLENARLQEDYVNRLKDSFPDNDQCPQIILKNKVYLGTTSGRITEGQWLLKMMSEGFYINESLNYMKMYLAGKVKMTDPKLQIISLANPKYKPHQLITFTHQTRDMPVTGRLFKELNDLADAKGDKPTRFTFIFMVKPACTFYASNEETLAVACSLLPEGASCKI